MRLRTAAAATAFIASFALLAPGSGAQPARQTCSAAVTIPDCVPPTAPPLSRGATDVLVDGQTSATPSPAVLSALAGLGGPPAAPAVPTPGRLSLTG